MNTYPLRFFLCVSLLIVLLGCAAGEPTGSQQELQTPEVFDHKASNDTIDWRTVLGEDNPPEVTETDLEWPGEKMGLIGPIVVTGGTGSNRYVLVYDPAGVLVGGMTRREAQENPQRLEEIVRLAHERGEIQNLHALQVMSARKILNQMAGAAGKGEK